MATLLQLRTRAKSESDMVNSSFVADSEWNAFLNSGYSELYGIVTQEYGNDYNVQAPSTGYTFTTDGINQFFALPSDFFKLLGVDVLFGLNQWIQLKPFTFNQRNMYSGTNQAIPAAGQTVRLFYVPKLTALTVDASVTIDLQNDWEQYIITSAVIRALDKEESDSMPKRADLAALKTRIEAEGANRDAGNPQRVVDSRGRGSPTMAYRLNGANLWLVGQRVDAWPTSIWGDSAFSWGW